MKGKKPKSVLLIGWTFIILSVLSMISGIFCLVIFSTFRSMTPEEIRVFYESMTEKDAAFMLVLEYSGILALIQIIPAAIVLIVSIFFLLLRTWARIGIEIVCWAGLAYSILSLILIGIFWSSRMPGIGVYTSGLSLVFGIALTIAAAIPFIFIIKFLSRQNIKELFSKTLNI